ncbi:LacI family DNA-binding transcriptional regulator [Marinomonas mediterranea]|jgi:Transcriptional regulators|uniref:Transcriptional regulator, LacI family n=1 Tax=Marinomonas mediterranea (strain ATCC 700492 / JCM 21426 / NBRC 103028 / MMB-1) TaxID=717774 RepID=F2K432_MARM1|nr:LacI family DNA-binding transcriptional regulator [Marinomonas mediterranea]ADZ91374.1 transcriptional regulator, LacI family [Marinomonas mediterranea MMB-1]WCN09346.1 substrate-binding domain-containing protein [Marinomonas mediterranea]WCN17491.1 substrate-binding domain-containing protein [Marinomonas mediterranea MMB-1]
MPNSTDRPITQKDVAELAGVSLSAVSRTFTSGASVSPATRQKVLIAAKALGYKTNILAQSLMTNRTRLIGVISSNFENPMFTEVLDQLTKALQYRGYRTMVENVSAGSKPEDVLEQLLQYRVDGVLFLSSVLPTSFAQACSAANLPATILFGRTEQDYRHKEQSINVITADNVNGAKMGAELLIEKGYRNIGFLGGPEEATTTRDRKQSIVETLNKHQLTLVAEQHCDAYTYDAALTKSKEMLAAYPDLDAVFCGDDVLAIAVLDTLRELGVDCPNQVGVLGFNDMAISTWGAYQLTTIRQPAKAMVEAAIELTLRQIEEPTSPCEYKILPCETVIRRTIRP